MDGAQMININAPGDICQSENLIAYLYLPGINRIELYSMHELSLVLSILEIAREQAKIHSADRIESIELEIGELAGVEMDALLFAWDAAVPGTVLENSERIVRHIPGKARCSVCSGLYKIHSLFDVCPDCGAYLSEALEGREFRVKSLVVS